MMRGDPLAIARWWRHVRTDREPDSPVFASGSHRVLTRDLDASCEVLGEFLTSSRPPEPRIHLSGHYTRHELEKILASPGGEDTEAVKPGLSD